MLRSSEKIIENNLHKHIIRDIDLGNLFKGSDARRYALVNKALKKQELIRISRGYYLMAQKYQKDIPSQHYIANRIAPNSFVSAESALSFHGWIPEKVTQTISIIAFGRNKEFETPFGYYIYKKTPVLNHNFFIGVKAHTINNNTVYIASPMRALIDYLYLHKIKDANIDFLASSLRIENANIFLLSTPDRKQEIKQLLNIYNINYINDFLRDLI